MRDREGMERGLGHDGREPRTELYMGWESLSDQREIKGQLKTTDPEHHPFTPTQEVSPFTTDCGNLEQEGARNVVSF